MNPQYQDQRYKSIRAACKPRTRALIADCELCITDDVLTLTIPPEAHPHHILKRYQSLINVAASQGLGLTISDRMFARVHHLSDPPLAFTR